MVYFQLEIVCCQDGIGHSDRHQQLHQASTQCNIFISFLHCNCQDEVFHLLLNSSHSLIQLKARETCQSSSISKHEIEGKVQKYWSTEKEFWAHLLQYLHGGSHRMRSGGDSVWQLSISNAAMMEWWNGVATNRSRKPHFHSRQSVNYTLARSRQQENYSFLHRHNQQFRIFQTKIPQNKKYLKTDRYRVFWAEAESVKVYAFFAE